VDDLEEVMSLIPLIPDFIVTIPVAFFVGKFVGRRKRR
jgi:hypothetical protein